MKILLSHFTSLKMLKKSKRGHVLRNKLKLRSLLIHEKNQKFFTKIKLLQFEQVLVSILLLVHNCIFEKCHMKAFITALNIYLIASETFKILKFIGNLSSKKEIKK